MRAVQYPSEPHSEREVLFDALVLAGIVHRTTPAGDMPLSASKFEIFDKSLRVGHSCTRTHLKPERTDSWSGLDSSPSSPLARPFLVQERNNAAGRLVRSLARACKLPASPSILGPSVAFCAPHLSHLLHPKLGWVKDSKLTAVSSVCGARSWARRAQCQLTVLSR